MLFLRYLDRENLPNLLELKYQSVDDTMAELGSVAEISEVFIGFQGYLYLQKDTEQGRGVCFTKNGTCRGGRGKRTAGTKKGVKIRY